jgi:glycosyltransferase involved in cell wall biosynthesis
VVDTDLFYPPAIGGDPRDTQKRLLVVASLVPVKGIPYLLQAVRQLQSKRRDFSLDVVGDGPSREAYEQMTADLGLEGTVTFHGMKSKPEVAEFMRQCDIFVLPSVWETAGVVLIEAMSSGKPVIAARVGGVPEMIDKRAGLLVPPENVAALTEALDYMLDHYQEYSSEEIARYARERYSYEVVGKTLDDVYRRIIRSGNQLRQKSFDFSKDHRS